MFEMVADADDLGVADPGDQIRRLFRYDGGVVSRKHAVHVQVLGVAGLVGVGQVASAWSLRSLTFYRERITPVNALGDDILVTFPGIRPYHFSLKSTDTKSQR